MNNVDVVYTPWHNLKKTASMDVGQVGFHNSKMVSILFLNSWSMILIVPCASGYEVPFSVDGRQKIYLYLILVLL